MKSIENLEIHLAHSCNLTCEGCSHYSNQGHKGILSLDEADRWMKQWNHRLAPKVFSLLGGEPTIHPRLADCVRLARQNWPTARLRLVTNGFFLHRHPDLPVALQDPNSVLYFSIHHKSAEYQEKLLPIIRLLVSWVRQYGIKVEYYKSYENWTRRYKGYGSAMEPFDDMQPRRSWENCPAKFCRQLFEGKIWKCSPLAYLQVQNERHKLSDQWTSYLQYQPLEPDCTEAELNAFFAKEEEPYCNMCPANPERFEIPNPMNSHAAAARDAGTPAPSGGRNELPLVSQ